MNGCFWHRHEECVFSYNPKSNQAFWSRKFGDNVQRDRTQKAALETMGWRVLTIWACEVNSADRMDSLALQVRDPDRSILLGDGETLPLQSGL